MPASEIDIRVFLDLGDTLVHLRADVVAEALKDTQETCQTNVTVKEWEDAIRDEWLARLGENLQWVKNSDHERLYWRIFFRNVLCRLGVPHVPTALLSRLAKMQASPASFACFPDTWNTMKVLKERGVRMGMISNAFPSANKILDHFMVDGRTLRSEFDPDLILLSFNEPWAKPKSNIYRHAVKLARVKPAQVIFVDDRPHFVDAADALGIRAYLIDRDGRYPSWKGRRVSSLAEIVEIVRILQGGRMHRALSTVKQHIKDNLLSAYRMLLSLAVDRQPVEKTVCAE